MSVIRLLLRDLFRISAVSGLLSLEVGPLGYKRRLDVLEVLVLGASKQLSALI